jgi:UDP-glucose 4-epimerase
MRVAVTGGAGNIGSHLVDAALREGAREVVALDALVRGTPENLRDALSTGRVRFLTMDIRDAAAVRDALSGCDVVFHQAALRWTRCQEAPRECQEVMVDGTFNVAEAAIAGGARRIVFASSALVYGDPRRLPLDEDHPLDGSTMYAAAKIASEQLLRATQRISDIRVAVLRYFNVYGPRMDVRSKYVEVMVRWLNLIDEGRPLTLFGEGLQSADFVYVGDVVEANLRAATAASPFVTANVCSGDETRMRDLAALMLELTGSRAGVTFQPEAPGALPARRTGDPAAAERLLGFRASTTLREGLTSLIKWRSAELSAPVAVA